jgi:GWxTD domain-containing protein
MRFITTKQEYENLVKSDDLKKDVDEFWFKTAGNSERATEIIKEYYSRVETANKHFTSHTQGWATDRGLIFIIYGQPTSVTKTDNYETWVYSEKTNILSVEFTFYKMDNKFSVNNYVLDRSGSYKSSWYRFIDSWRQGRIYK